MLKWVYQITKLESYQELPFRKRDLQSKNGNI